LCAFTSSGNLFDHNGFGTDYGDLISLSYNTLVTLGITFPYLGTSILTMNVNQTGDVELLYNQ
jgi:hypothetical protein